MLADDAKALADSLGITGFHLMGISMGGMIAQEYALAYPGDLRSVTFACTYAAPGPFCSRMFAMWGDMAPVLGVPFVMRDVTLWAFTVPFFEQRESELAEFETAMRYMDQPLHAYLAQLAVIQAHDTASRLGDITTDQFRQLAAIQREDGTWGRLRAAWRGMRLLEMTSRVGQKIAQFAREGEQGIRDELSS